MVPLRPAILVPASGQPIACASHMSSVNLGGPCRGRTYGPLIKSEAKGAIQVLDDWAIPSSCRIRSVVGESGLLVDQ